METNELPEEFKRAIEIAVNARSFDSDMEKAEYINGAYFAGTLALQSKEEEIAKLNSRITELTAVGMGFQQKVDDSDKFIKNLQWKINDLNRCLGWSNMEPHHPIGTRLGYAKINEEPDWDRLADLLPPEDNHLENKAWRGAWLEGQMSGYAKCMKNYKAITSENEGLKSEVAYLKTVKRMNINTITEENTKLKAERDSRAEHKRLNDEIAELTKPKQDLQLENDRLKLACNGLDRNMTRVSEENLRLRELLRQSKEFIKLTDWGDDLLYSIDSLLSQSTDKP